MKCYPEFKEREEMRKIIGRYGLTGKQQVTMETLEDTSTRLVPKLLATNHQVVFTLRNHKISTAYSKLHISRDSHNKASSLNQYQRVLGLRLAVVCPDEPHREPV